MLAAIDRADAYLREAVRWSEELRAYLKAGVGKERDLRRHERFLKRASIPANVWFPLESTFSETDRLNLMATLYYWGEGTLDTFHADYDQMEDGMDLDPTYILFGVPIYALSVKAQAELRNIGEKFAFRSLNRRGRDPPEPRKHRARSGLGASGARRAGC